MKGRSGRVRRLREITEALLAGCILLALLQAAGAAEGPTHKEFEALSAKSDYTTRQVDDLRSELDNLRENNWTRPTDLLEIGLVILTAAAGVIYLVVKSSLERHVGLRVENQANIAVCKLIVNLAREYWKAALRMESIGEDDFTPLKSEAAIAHLEMSKRMVHEMIEKFRKMPRDLTHNGKSAAALLVDAEQSYAYLVATYPAGASEKDWQDALRLSAGALDEADQPGRDLSEREGWVDTFLFVRKMYGDHLRSVADAENDRAKAWELRQRATQHLSRAYTVYHRWCARDVGDEFRERFRGELQ